MQPSRFSRLFALLCLGALLAGSAAPLMARPAAVAPAASLWQTLTGWLDALLSAAGAEMNEAPWAEPNGRVGSHGGSAEANEAPCAEPNG